MTWSRSRVAGFLEVELASLTEVLRDAGLVHPDGTDFDPGDVAATAEVLRGRSAAATGWTGDFHRDGFALLRSALTAGDVEVLQDLTSACTADESRGTHIRSESGSLVRINSLERHGPAVEAFQGLGLSEIATELVEDALLYRASVVFRSHLSPPEIGAHRDPRWTGRSLGRPVFAIGVNLDPATGEVGDVYFQPGSHLLGPDGGVPPVGRAPDVEVVPTTRSGDVIVHNLGVIHGADTYARPRERVTYYFSFVSAADASSAQW